MNLFDRRDRRRLGFGAFLAVVICGLVMGVPSGALGAEQSCLHREPERLSVSIPHLNPGHYVVEVHTRGQECFLEHHPEVGSFSGPSGVFGLPVYQLGQQTRVDLRHGDIADFTLTLISSSCGLSHPSVTGVTFRIPKGELQLVPPRARELCAISALVSPFRGPAPRPAPVQPQACEDLRLSPYHHVTPTGQYRSFYILKIVNFGHTCSLDGYPSVLEVGSSSGDFRPHARALPGFQQQPHERVVMPREGSAFFTFSYTVNCLEHRVVFVVFDVGGLQASLQFFLAPGGPICPDSVEVSPFRAHPAVPLTPLRPHT
jgi:hypothetical protein